ncbi:hypothetical protein [Sphingomonas sp. OTU376]|uniref:hypothetical protein n=1 Tax=Sphingomonas sp. OTU376 TaxID=3043863 RepID=UPI00313B27C3
MLDAILFYNPIIIAGDFGLTRITSDRDRAVRTCLLGTRIDAFSARLDIRANRPVTCSRLPALLQIYGETHRLKALYGD